MKKWAWLAVIFAIFLIIGIGVFVAQQTPIMQTKQIRLVVLAEEGNFQIVCSDELEVKAGQDVGFSIDVTPLLGFNRAIAFTIEGGPPGMTVSWPLGNVWQPGQLDPDNIQCNLTIPLDNSLVGEYFVMLTGAAIDQ
jgi:hypothetical protein